MRVKSVDNKLRKLLEEWYSLMERGLQKVEFSSWRRYVMTLLHC